MSLSDIESVTQPPTSSSGAGDTLDCDYLANWIGRTDVYRELLKCSIGGSNHTTATRAAFYGTVDMASLKGDMDEVTRRGGKSDFSLIKLIRLLFTEPPTSLSPTAIPSPAQEGRPETVLDALLRESEAADADYRTRGTTLQDAKVEIDFILSTFAFWVDADDTKEEFHDIVFWSENHTFMYLSSAHLFRARAEANGLAHRDPSGRWDRLLKHYLKAHLQFQGVYEVLSHVYLPYTMCALMNLYDFSSDEAIRDDAKKLLDVILRQILVCSSDSGVANLTGNVIITYLKWNIYSQYLS